MRVVCEVLDLTFTLNTVFTTAFNTYSQYKAGVHHFMGIASLLDFSLK